MVLLRKSVSINPTLTMEIELLCKIHHPQKTFQGIFPGSLLLNYAKQVIVMSIKFQIPDKHWILWYTFKIQRLTHTLRSPFKICLGVQTVDIRHREIIPKFLYWRHRCFQKEFFPFLGTVHTRALNVLGRDGLLWKRVLIGPTLMAMDIELLCTFHHPQ